MLSAQMPDAGNIAQDVTQTVSGLENQWSQFWHMFLTSPADALQFLGGHALGVASKAAIALIIFFVGRWIIRRVRKFVAFLLSHRRIDSSVRIFFDYVVSIFLWIFLSVIIISVLGWKMTGLVAIFAAAAFAVGMALSGTLSNFAGGIIILLLKPFRIGDNIDAQGYTGVVKSIELFNTTVITSDNRTIIMPNGPLSTGIVNNVMRQSTRMLDWRVTVVYGTDYSLAEKVIGGILAQEKRFLPDPASTIALNELGASGIVITTRAWVKSADYQDVQWDINLEIYKALIAAGIQFVSGKQTIILSNNNSNDNGD